MARENLNNQASSRLAGQFSDYVELARLSGWDLGFRQLDPGPQSISADMLGGKRLTVMHMKFNRAFHQKGNPPKGYVSFGMPTKGMTDWFGRPYQSQSILPFNCSSGVDGISTPDFEAFTLSINKKYLEEISELFKLPVPDYLLRPNSGSYIPDSQAVRNLRGTISCLLNNQSLLFDDEQESSLVIELLGAALEGPRTEDKSSPAMRSRAISLSLDYVEEHQHEAVDVGDICAATGVAWRTLNRAYKERFGIGPKAYMQRRRLSSVRDQLLAHPENTLVADIANKWGFWHMGQFALDYRKMFGELPSESLKRNH